MKTDLQNKKSARRRWVGVGILLLYGSSLVSYVAWAACNGKVCASSPTTWEDTRTCTRYVRDDQDCVYPHSGPNPTNDCQRVLSPGVRLRTTTGTPITFKLDLNFGICTLTIDFGCIFCDYSRATTVDSSTWGYICAISSCP